MADNVTLPNLTWTTTNFSVTNANQYIRDQLDAYFQAIAGDASVDAAIWQAIKSGALSARSGVAHKVGRQYQSTDTGQEIFNSDGTSWRHSARGAYDDMVRTASATITPSKSGHTWAEVSGTWDIVAGASPPVNFMANSAATTAVATLDTGSLLDRAYSIHTGFTTHTTQANIDVGIIVKYADASNLTYVQLLPTAINIQKVNSTTGSAALGSQPFSPAANTYHELVIECYGQMISATITSPTLTGARTSVRHDDFDHANLAAATKVGFRVVSATPALTGFSSIAVKF